MKLSIFCEDCNKEVVSCTTEYKQLLGSLLFTAHANGHSIHKLHPRVDDKDLLESQLMIEHYQTHEVIIRCGQPGCTNAQGKTVYNYRVPLCLIAAMAIAVHSAHEGHILNISVDSISIHPPG